MNSQITRPRSIVRPLTMTLAWCLSAVTLIAGLTMYFLGANETTRLQIAAGSGQITDPAEYYGPLTNAEAMSSLSTILIGVALLSLVLCLLATALLPTRSEVAIDAGFDTAPTDAPVQTPATDALETGTTEAAAVVEATTVLADDEGDEDNDADRARRSQSTEG